VVQTKRHSVPLKVQTSAAKRRDAQTPTLSDSAGTLSLKSITEFCYAQKQREIKEGIRERWGDTRKREQEFFTHTASFLIFGGYVD